ncbi:MAG: FAD-binding protein [Acidimicrobiales bacterium]
MLDIVTKDGEACGIVTRDMLTGEVHAHSAHAVVLATGGYGNVYYLSTNAMASNVTAAWRAHRKGAPVRQPPATPRSTRPASPRATSSSRSSR